MIYGNIHSLDAYGFLAPGVLESLRYAASHDLSGLERGRYELPDSPVYFNVVGLTTAPVEERSFEAHRLLIDIHYILSGHERVDLAFASNMTAGEYQPESDLLSLEGAAVASVALGPGDFLICYPEDGHRPGVQVDGSEQVEKIVFKVPV